jgi:hypothetical protein
MNPRALVAICSAFVLAAVLTHGVTAAGPDPIERWSIEADESATATGMHPLRSPITLALLHLAVYDAVHAVTGGRALYSTQPVVRLPASAEAAAIEAGYRILLAEFPSRQSTFDGVRQELIGMLPGTAATDNGVEVGAAVARQLLALRANDGRNSSVPYAPQPAPGVWQPTPPGFLSANSAFLGLVTPFTMERPAQFRPPGPPALGSQRWADDYEEVRTLGARDNSSRTTEMTATALFWQPLAGTVWPATIRRLAREQALDLAASAHFQAVTFAAFADSLIACWDAKFHYGFWRPVTAIRQGGMDGHPFTNPDPAWEPLALTPAFPEYPSGHTCATAAVAHAIEDYFPHDVLIPARNVVSSDERVYRRAKDVVDEVIEARMLIGVHFRTANEDGAEIGRKIARQIRSRWFKREGS